MPAFRFNHMELTMPPGTLVRDMEAIKSFYAEIFDFEAIEVPVLETPTLVLRTDEHTSQFLLLTEQEKHLHSPGFDHLGFIYETRTEVDDIHARCQQWQKDDDRLRIKDYEDIMIGPSTTRAFYIQYLLPIWFDIQVVEYEPGTAPDKGWAYS
ncbi:MAG: hypothetical protein ACI9JM_003158 [Halioglobus sp.]|jgi:catechol 2,3-dioxygenase-like lactoylglutathione lyase family enzyme